MIIITNFKGRVNLASRIKGGAFICLAEAICYIRSALGKLLNSLPTSVVCCKQFRPRSGPTKCLA